MAGSAPPQIAFLTLALYVVIAVQSVYGRELEKSIEMVAKKLLTLLLLPPLPLRASKGVLLDTLQQVLSNEFIRGACRYLVEKGYYEDRINCVLSLPSGQ